MVRALLNEYDVLVDDTHTSRESMLRLLEMDNTAQWVFINTPPEECCRRADETGQGDLRQVIMRQFKNLHEQVYDVTGGGSHDLTIENIHTVVNHHRRYVAQHSSFKVVV